MKASGIPWEAELQGDKLEIRPNPLFGKSAEKWTINIRQLIRIDFRPAGFLSLGSLKLVAPGLERPIAHLFMKQPNVLEFSRHEQPQFEALRDAIAARLAGTISPSES